MFSDLAPPDAGGTRSPRCPGWAAGRPSSGGGRALIIEIAPGFDALYYSPYIEGLTRIDRQARLRWTRKGFPELGHHGLGFRWNGRRIFISASDGPGLNPAALEWADVFGKANLELGAVSPRPGLTLLALGPSFPVRVWGPVAAWLCGVGTWLRVRGRAHQVRRHFSAFRSQYRHRLPETDYYPAASDPGYVFFLARLWSQEDETNRHRGLFVEAARRHPSLRFEGGFVPRSEARLSSYRALFADGTVELSEWVAKTRRSVIVFNTPAVAGCHGWKLAEYLALGKAILSTPLLRAMPAPLVHGEHAHFVDGSATAIEAGVEMLLSDDRYRRKLEAGAREYYERYLSPQAVMGRLVRTTREGAFEE